jgi:ribose 5-phosphate isomerase B
MKDTLRIAIGSDHRGFFLKQYLINNFSHKECSISWDDVGAYNDERSDYPEFSIAVCHLMLKQQVDYGILLCGSGVGMAVAANRFSGIYAGVAWNQDVARLCKEDDNINVLVVPADFVDQEETAAMVRAWLDAEFKHDRYEKRIAMIDAITK